jgi:hypothetical protein
MPMLCYPRNKLPGSVKPTSLTDGLDREFFFSSPQLASWRLKKTRWTRLLAVIACMATARGGARSGAAGFDGDDE